jgi:hypothetical protein
MPKVICPNGHRLQIKDANMGQIVRCPGCQASFVATPAPDDGGGDFGAASGEGALGGGRGSAFSIRNLTNWLIGKPALFFGVLLVLFGRGCDALGVREVSSTQARLKYATEKWKNDWEDKMRPLEKEKEEEQEKLFELTKPRKDKDKGDDDDLQDKIKAINKRIKRIEEEKEEKKRDKRKDGEEKHEKYWLPLERQAQYARTNHSYYAYWYEWGFIGGTIILMFGLLIIAFTAVGAERWIAYIMITIITFSIYVGGAPWLESMRSSQGPEIPPPIIKGGG